MTQKGSTLFSLHTTKIMAFFVLLFLCFYLPVYYNVILLMDDVITTDHQFHIQKGLQLFSDNAEGVYPLYHILIHFFAVILGFSSTWSAIIMECVFALMTAGFYFYYLRHKLLGYSLKLHHYFTAVFFLVVAFAMWLPQFNHVYLGQGSPNVWHNPTLNIMKPFALLGLFFALDIFSAKPNRWYLFLGFVCCGLSVLAKPSFIIAFLPAIWIVAFIKWYLHQFSADFFKQCFFYLLFLSLVSVFLLLYQYIFYFGTVSVGTQIGIDYLLVWSKYSPNVFISICLGLGFPLYIIVMRFKQFTSDAFAQMALLVTLFSLLSFMFLYEQDGRTYDANFSWSYVFSQALIFLCALVEYIRWRFEVVTARAKILMHIGSVLLFWHVATGVLVWFNMINYGHYYPSYMQFPSRLIYTLFLSFI